MTPKPLTYLVPIACLAIGAVAGWNTTPAAKPTLGVEKSSAQPASATPVVSPVPQSAEPRAAENPVTAGVDDTIESAMRYPSVLHRRAALKRVFEAMSLSELKTTLTRVRSIAETEPEVLEMFARVWAERDPIKGARELLILPEGTSRSKALTAFARAWGRRDVTAAMAWAEQYLTGSDLEITQRYLKSRRATQEPPKSKSLDEIQAIGSREERSTALHQHFRDLIGSDPKGALKQAESLRDESDRGSIRLTVSNNWARQDPAAFLAWLKESQTKNPSKGIEWTTWSMALSTASSELLKKDPDQVRQLIADWPDGHLRRDLANRYATKIVEQDPDAALAFVEDMKLRDTAFGVQAILPGLFLKDPAKGGELLMAELEQLAAKNTGGQTAVSAMKPWITKDAQAAAQFATGIPEPAMPSVFYAVSEVWCAKDGRAALQWASELPSGKPKEHAMRQFTYTWAKHDTQQSTTWLNSLPNDAHRWAATEGFVCATFDTDPDAALGWARSIPDEKKRTEILAGAWNNWESNNSKSARDWLENSQLSEPEREAIYKRWR